MINVSALSTIYLLTYIYLLVKLRSQKNGGFTRWCWPSVCLFGCSSVACEICEVIRYAAAPGGVRRLIVSTPIHLFNPLEPRGNYSAASNNMKLVHWPLMGGLLHLVQGGGDWTGPQSTPQRPVHQITVLIIFYSPAYSVARKQTT